MSTSISSTTGTSTSPTSLSTTTESSVNSSSSSTIGTFSTSSLDTTSETSLTSLSTTSASTTSISSTTNSSTSVSSSSSGDEGMNYSNVIDFLSAEQTAAINAETNVMSAHNSFGAGQYLDVRQQKSGRLFLYIKGGNAGCSLTVTFYFQISPDTRTWHDLPGVAVTLSGTSVIEDANTTVGLDLASVPYIRLQRIGNAETVAGYTALVNAALYVKQW